MSKINGVKDKFNHLDQTKTQKYKADERQLKEDRSYFESLFAKAMNGDTTAAKELSSIKAQETVQVYNGNDRLLNSNTSYLLMAQNEVNNYTNKNKNDKDLNPEQKEQKNLIMDELQKNPENNDITEADVQNYILQEQIV